MKHLVCASDLVIFLNFMLDCPHVISNCNRIGNISLLRFLSLFLFFLLSLLIIILTFNVFLFLCSVTIALANTLSLDGTPDDGTFNPYPGPSLMDSYDYVMHGRYTIDVLCINTFVYYLLPLRLSVFIINVIVFICYFLFMSSGYLKLTMLTHIW